MRSLLTHWASRYWLALSASLFGTVYAAYILGDRINPSVVDWLLNRIDPATHYLGWVFFRNDEWRWPLTFTDSIVYPTGISIAYTDSIPLLAIPAKVLSHLSLLPDNFQYFGLYSALSLVLQFYWGGALGLLYAPRTPV